MVDNARGTDAHHSLRRIIGTLLNTPTFWSQSDLSVRLRQDIEGVARGIDSLGSSQAADYVYAFAALAIHLPHDIGSLYQGDLAELVREALKPCRLRH